MRKKSLITLLILSLFLVYNLAFAAEESSSQMLKMNNNQGFNRPFGWVRQATGFADPTRGINYIWTVNAGTVWAVAYDGSGAGAPVQEYTKTVNGGEEWIPGEIDVPDTNLEPAMIFAMDDQKAWCPMHSGSPQGIYHTFDGGANWSRIGAADMYTQTGSFPNVVHFFDENNGFAQGDPVDGYYELYTTTDGGATWDRVPERNIPAPLTGEFGIVGYYSAVGDILWWGTNKGRVYKSTDKGYYWTVCDQVGSLTYVDIWFKDSMNGILQDKGASTTGTLYETSDGGDTWTLINTTGTVYYNDISYVPGTANMYVSTGADYQNDASGASYSEDGGHTWTVFNGTAGTQFLHTDWVHDECGYAGEFNDDQFTGGMFKYTYVSAPVLPPENLTAEAQPDLTVDLDWSPPPSGMEGWIRWDNGDNAGSLGLQDPGEWSAASKFSPTDMLPYDGGQITKIKFFPTSETTDYEVAIWTGTSGGTVEIQQAVTGLTIGDWNEITLDTPVDVDGTKTYWIGYHMNQVDVGQPNGYPAGYDSGPAQNGLWANLGSGWQDLVSQGFDYNWNVAGYIENPDGKLVKMEKGKSRDLTEYNIYHSLESGEPYDLVGTVPASDTTYTHTGPTTGATNYYVVSAVYGQDESDFSNEASAYVEISTAEELIYDDGSAESSYSSGNIYDNLAVKMTPDTYPVSLMRIKYYFTAINEMLIVRVWDDNGPDNEPGTQLIDPMYTVPTMDLAPNDWNVITLPDDYDVVITSGSFYVGLTEAGNPNLLGIDEGPSFDRSWQYTGDMWFDHTMGVPQNMMIRAVVNTEVSVDPNNNPENLSTISHFPNPVRNSVNFKYNMKSQNEQPVKIKVYNILGQKVDEVVGEDGEATWIPTEHPNGIYFYSIDEKGFSKTNKLILMR